MDEASSKSLPKPSNLKKYSQRQRYKSDSYHEIIKTAPPKDKRNPNNIYVTNKADFKGQLAHCVKLLDKGEAEIVLHGLGAAVPRAINLALQLEEKFSGSYQLDVHTGTVHLTDEIVSDLQEPNSQQSRNNSCVKIRVFKSS